MRFQRKTLAAALMCAVGGMVFLPAGVAFAQQTGADAQKAGDEKKVQVTEKVLVTGTRILSENAEASAPVQIITSEEIAASGVTNIQDLLLKNPTFGVPSISRTNSNFSTSSAGVSTIDLRNLGTSRTLVLIDGRRVVAGVPGETAVDLNTIPTQFVERIEIMTGGASSTYGSDAVAGVVNIIMKKNYEGFHVDAKYGVSEQHDDIRKEVGLTFGTGNARGNLMGHFGYSDQGAVMSRDRDFSAVDQISRVYFTEELGDIFTPRRPYYSSYAPQGRFFHDTGSLTFDANGNAISWSTNGPRGDGVGATGFNRSHYRTIAIPAERYLFSAKGDYEIVPEHRAFFLGNYASSKTTSELEPFPLGSEDIFEAAGGQVPAEFMVGGQLIRNPLVPDALYNLISDTDGDGLRDYYFTRRLAEVGNRGNVADRDTFSIVAGLEGKLLGSWNYTLFSGFGSTKESQVSSGQVNVLNFRNALEAIADVDDVDGDGDRTEAICRDANARAQGCVPINVFGFNSISAAALRYVTAPGSLSTYTSQKLFGGTVSAEPFSVPAGPVGVAAGFEYRDEYSRSEFDALTQAGLNAGNALPPVKGGFDVKEAFAEVRVPLLKNAPMAQSLNLTGAIRGGKYSTVGSTLSWNAGMDWSPSSSIKVRGNAALSTRAPNISELFTPPSQTFPTGLVDPCLGVTATSTEPQAERCRANPGVAANIAANGSFTLNQADIQGVSGYDRGNPNLQDEQGKSWTLGLAVTPKNMGLLSKFALTLDYFDITIDDAIVSTPRGFILNQCYSGDASFCQFITRRPAAVGANSAGSLSYVDSASTNSGELATKGFDLTVNFSDRVGPGTLTAALTYTHVLEGYVTPLPGAAQDPFAGEIGAPTNKFSLQTGYKWGNFKFGLQTTYIGESALDDQFLRDFGFEPGSAKVPAKVYNDLSVAYKPNKLLEIYGGIYNLFNTKPALVISGLPGNDTGTETEAGTYDPIGRRYYLGVRLKF